MNERFEKSMASREPRLSTFLAQELLLDFLDGEVSGSRRSILEDRFSSIKELKKSRHHIEAARAYALQLREVEPSIALIEKMQGQASGWSSWTERLALRKWPDVARWSAEALLISAVFVGLVLLLPAQKLKRWIPLPSRGVVLKEVETTYPVQPSQEANPSRAPTPQDERVEDQAQQTKTVNVPTPISPPMVFKPHAVVVAQPVSIEPAAPSLPATQEAKVASAANRPKSDTTKTEPKESASDTKSKGFVFRANLEVNDLKGTTEGLKDLVESLQGKKAGQVDLGWQQDLDHSYFHFSLPEKNFQTLMSGVRSFGRVRIFRDTHWRVMPPGQVRIILEVKGTVSAPVEGGSSAPKSEAGSWSGANKERGPTPESKGDPSPATESAD